jgi:S-disulfanyl-L-cysteine oxidoreductase SoxD
MSSHRLLQATLVLLSAASFPALSDSADAPKSGAYTAAQAATGKVAVESSCGICHLRSLRGRSGEPDESPPFDALPRAFQDFIKTGYVPPLVGEEFLAKWKGKTVIQLAENLGSAGKSFPTAGMDDKTYLQIAAYVLQLNGVPAGERELTADSTMTVDAAVGLRKVAAR